jgi:hypothetical protein
VGEDGLQFLWIHYSNTLGKDFLSKGLLLVLIMSYVIVQL